MLKWAWPKILNFSHNLLHLSSPKKQKMMIFRGWIRKSLQHKIMETAFKFFTNSIIFREWRDRINEFLVVCKCSRLCVYFDGSTVYFKCIPDFWPNLNFLLRHLIIFVLWCVIFRRMQTDFWWENHGPIHSYIIYKKTYHNCTLTYMRPCWLKISKFHLVLSTWGKLANNVSSTAMLDNLITFWNMQFFMTDKFCWKHPLLPSWSNLKLSCRQRL